MKLPQGDGATVFRLVRETNPQARTVVITGHRSEMDQLVQSAGFEKVAQEIDPWGIFTVSVARRATRSAR